MIDKKKAFENSFKGYHKDAPSFLHSKSKALHKAKSDKKYKQYLEDSHSATAEHRGGNEN